MDERTLFSTRLSALEGALDRAWPPGGQAPEPVDDDDRDRVDAKLYELVSASLEVRVDNLRRQVETLRRAVESDQPLERCWTGYSAVALACEPLFEECLAVRQGAIARTTGLDGGICLLSDGLAYEICQRAGLRWRRFTVLGAGESFTYLSDVIRVRFPDLSTWDLPLVAHELGHHAALRLERPSLGKPANPFHELVAMRAGREPEEVVEEHFADAFAALTVGPAYALTCLLMRFEPTDEGDDAHPPDLERARVMLAVLRREAEDSADGAGLSSTLDVAERIWAASCAGAGISWEASGRDELAAALHEKLRDSLPASARYGAAGHTRASWLARRLRELHYEPALGPEDGVVVVLNAAWLARLAAAGNDVERATAAEHARALLDQWVREPVTAA